MEYSEVYRGFKIDIKPDNHYEADDQSEDLFLVFDHRDFTVKRDGFKPLDIFETAWQTGTCVYDEYWVFGIDAYIHGGVVLAIKNSREAMNFPDRRWDVSFRGFVLVKKGIKGFSIRHTQAFKRAKSLLEEWNYILSGEVYGYDIPALGDSCWGFVGPYKRKGRALNALAEARSIIDHHLKVKDEHTIKGSELGV